ncbi:MAG: type II toxin-antitoxin system RelE/ParE family toxin [Clostridia bacterium]|nr:type II toxin-antitoxin system RelE/ParE family toxin [Clostridia bacterium]
MAKNKYTIRYLPSFSEELNEIIYYISFTLKNKKAAEKMLYNVYTAIEQRIKNPESYEIYKSKINMKYNWYRIYVGNFTIFYTVSNNIIEIAHLIYSARNIEDFI